MLISCSVLSKVKQRVYKSEIQRLQKIGSKFRKAALQDCEQDERASILTLADKLRNICFEQRLYSDRIQITVRSRNHSSFDDIDETALEEESAISSKIKLTRVLMQTQKVQSAVKEIN